MHSTYTVYMTSIVIGHTMHSTYMTSSVISHTMHSTYIYTWHQLLSAIQCTVPIWHKVLSAIQCTVPIWHQVLSAIQCTVPKYMTSIVIGHTMHNTYYDIICYQPYNAQYLPGFAKILLHLDFSIQIMLGTSFSVQLNKFGYTMIY